MGEAGVMIGNWARPLLAAFLGGALRGAPGRADQVLFRDDFSGRTRNRAWVQTYGAPAGSPGFKQLRGLLLAGHSVCWYLASESIAIEQYPHGVRLAADLFFYPRPGFEWRQTGNPYPLGFQNDNKGGVGTIYARFRFIDADGDGRTDTIRFETSDGRRRLTTDLSGYNPATAADFHRFAIDWKPHEIRAYFDQKNLATHKIALKGPLWVVGRNEYINMLMDNFELRELGRNSGPPRAPTSVVDRSPRSRPRADTPRYWYLRGLHHEAYRIEEMFPAGVLTVSDGWSAGMAPPLPPREMEDLFGCDAAIIANIDLRSIGPAGKRNLRDFLRGGGGLLVLGGKAAYASGGWRGSILEQMLPVRVGEDPWDLARTPDGTLRKDESHGITRDLDLSGRPRAEFVNHVAGVKDGAKVLLRAGDAPFLVVWESQGCRVACVLGTPYGAAETNYFGWAGWDPLLRNVLRWLGNQDKER